MIIAQISDSHVELDNAQAIIHMQQAVNHLNSLPVLPDLVLVTGDCVNGGKLSEYELFKELIRPLSMPVYVIPGNHDDRQQMLSVFGSQGSQALMGFVQYVIDAGPVRLIALDTHVPGGDDGYLCAKRLQWLDDRLAEAAHLPTLIFMHHPPFPTGLNALDEMGLNNADEFRAVIDNYRHIERITAGHIHMAMTRRFAGTIAMTCPATSTTMLPDVSHPERIIVQKEFPACLLHVWLENTGLVTYTSRIGEPCPRVELHDGVRWLA